MVKKTDAYKVKIAKTLYSNTYRAQLLTSDDAVIGQLRIIPTIPLDRTLVPQNAPEVPFFLLVLVDDADINKDNLIDFEERASYTLLKRFSTETAAPQYCQFYYPSPAFVFEQKDATSKNFQN
jgi:hypothetical protein